MTEREAAEGLRKLSVSQEIGIFLDCEWPAAPMRIVSQIVNKPVGLLSPVANPTRDLGWAASFIKRISVSDLAASQFPDPVFGRTAPQFRSRLHGCNHHPGSRDTICDGHRVCRRKGCRNEE